MKGHNGGIEMLIKNAQNSDVSKLDIPISHNPTEITICIGVEVWGVSHKHLPHRSHRPPPCDFDFSNFNC